MSGPVAVLVGPPGAGKTTTGRALGELLGVPVADTDAEVERVAGRSVADIFVESGEAVFRELERAAVADALAHHPGVVAVGGGAPVDPASRALLAAVPVAFLDVSLAVAAKRVGFDAPRPLLLQAPRATWARLAAERRPVYLEVADVTVDTSELTPAAAAAAVAEGLGLVPTGAAPRDAG